MAFLKQKYKINRSRPTIGITGPDQGGGAAWFFTALAVWPAGGRPVRITRPPNRAQPTACRPSSLAAPTPTWTGHLPARACA